MPATIETTSAVKSASTLSSSHARSSDDDVVVHDDAGRVGDVDDTVPHARSPATVKLINYEGFWLKTAQSRREVAPRRRGNKKDTSLCETCRSMHLSLHYPPSSQ